MGPQGYRRGDPSTFDEALRVESALDADRSSKDCFCGASRNVGVWTHFLGELHASLAADPSFTGDWVHTLCGLVYPIIFRSISVEPTDDTFTMHSDCPAAILAMAVVCAQSAALRHEEERIVTPGGAAVGTHQLAETGSVARLQPGWRRTARVVLKEGPSAGDFYGEVSVKECFARCAAASRCRSFSHGPNGCHLKARCPAVGEPMHLAGVQGSDYRTYYQEYCVEVIGVEGTLAAVPGDEGRTEAGSDHLDDVEVMMGFAQRLLEFCFHCLDSSPWPFLVFEILENYAHSVEAPTDFRWRRAAGRMQGPSSRSGPAAGHDESLSLDAPGDLAQLAPERLTLLKLQVRWTRGLESEASFWRNKLSLDPEENISMERLLRWLEDGEVTWYYDDPCAWVEDALRRGAQPESKPAGVNSGRRPPRILNAGSGPFAPRPLECWLNPALLPAGAETRAEPGRWWVPVVAADGLARFYLRLMDEQGLVPSHNHMPFQCPVEELHTCYPPGHFDVAHMRNSLDHAFDPLLGIERLLHVVRPGGWVLLRHARNEGVPGKFRNGLHQWAFDTRDDAAGNRSFFVWNPELEVDVSAHLLQRGLAAEIRTELRDHPYPDAPPDEKYIWVDIRKPTVEEAAARRVTLSSEASAAALR